MFYSPDKPRFLSTFLLSWKFFCRYIRAVVSHRKQKGFASLLSYQGRRSPRAGCHKTTHHSALCKCSQRCSLGPSISRAGGPGRAESPADWDKLAAYATPCLSFPAPPTLVPSLVPILITYIAFYNIVGVIHDVPGQAKVTDLGYPSI